MSYDQQLKDMWDAYISEYALPSGIDGVKELVEQITDGDAVGSDEYLPGFLITWKMLLRLAGDLDQAMRFLMVVYCRSLEPGARKEFLSDKDFSSHFISFSG